MKKILPLALLLGFSPWATAGQPPPMCNGSISFDALNDTFATPGRISGSQVLRIQGGQLSADHLNLFHSFRCFNVPGGRTVSFRHDDPMIENIIARVSGDERSIIGGNINAELGADRAGRASLFLLNPNGVLFNGNTSSNLNALVVSTGNSLGFDSGATMTMDSTAGNLLMVTGHPVEFGHLSTSGTVEFDGARVEMTGDRGDVLVVAKDIALRNGSRMITDGSQIALVGAGPGNSVAFDVRNRGQVPILERPASGRVSMDGFSRLSTSHRAGGRIVIRGGVITLMNSNPRDPALGVADAVGGEPSVGIDVEATQSLTLTRAQISTGSQPDGTASDIRIRAPIIQLNSDVAGLHEPAIRSRGRGGNIDIETSDLRIDDGEISTWVDGGGTGGSISVDTNRLTITDRSSIQSVAQGSSSGGDIDIRAARDLFVDGNGATRTDADGIVIPATVGITANTLGEGRGGDISVDVGHQLTLRNGGLIDSTTFSAGDAGRIRVSAGDLTIDGENFPSPTGITGFTTDQTSPTAGRGGDIEVNVRGDIGIFSGGEIDTSSFGSGAAGRVSVNEDIRNLSGSIVIDRGSATRFTGIGSDASGSGDAGEVSVRTGSLSIYNGGLISTGVFYQPMVNADGIRVPINFGQGRGGDVSVFANSIQLGGAARGWDDGTSIVANSAIYAGTQAGSSGRSGTVTIDAQDSIDISQRGLIGVESLGTGRAGELRIRAGRDLNLDRGRISARASGDGGNIDIQAGHFITLTNGSEIEAEAGNDGGNVTIRGAEVVLLDDSRISANAVRGDGGNISIESDFLLVNSNSSITASSQFGLDGEISIDSVFDLSETMPRLDGKLLSQADEVEGLDPSKVPEDHSTFVPDGGRGGIPVDPGGYMPSLKIWALPLGD